MPNKSNLCSEDRNTKSSSMNVFIWSSDPSVGKKYLIHWTDRWQALLLLYQSFVVCLLWWIYNRPELLEQLPRIQSALMIDCLFSPRCSDWILLSSCPSQEIWLKIFLLDLRDWVKGERGEGGEAVSRIPDSVCVSSAVSLENVSI